MKQKKEVKKQESAFLPFTFGENKYSFNKAWVASKSLAEFSEHEKHHNLTPAQYKEVWDTCKGNKKEEKPAPAEK